MEQLVQYSWKHRLLEGGEMITTAGERVEILHPGNHNHDAGPDFLEAKIKIGGVLWVGNVEIHVRASDWYRHRHESDPAYSNIILHVVVDNDMQITYPDGSAIPQLVVAVPRSVVEHYDQLSRSDLTPRCARVLPEISRLAIHGWMTALTVERLEMRMQQVMDRWQRLDRNWEDTLFATMARNFGFGKNGDAFEAWAHSIPMSAVAKHRDDLFQIEAIFFGQAGLLNSDVARAHSALSAPASQHSDYYERLSREYRYLQQKFSLTPIDPSLWKFLRMRPQNFPHVRIAQLAMLYYNQKINMSRLLGSATVDEVAYMLNTSVSEYWRTHYTFGGEASTAHDKRLSRTSLNLIVINSVVPILFAYGRYKSNEEACELATHFLEVLPPERNHIITDWQAAGISAENAADTQALLQLTRRYCDCRDCLRCRFGHEFIRRTPDFLREEG